MKDKIRARLAGLVAALNEGGGPWGGRGGGSGGSGGSNGGGGPRNPWGQPPEGGKPRGPKASSALDELLRQAKNVRGQMPGGMKPAIWGYVAAGLVLLWIVLTSFHQINQQERGVVTRLGAYSHTLDSGISLTLPAPIDRVQVVDVQNIRTINIPDGAGERLVLTRDQNIIDLEYSVRWNIRDPELYLFQLVDPDATIKSVAESAMRAAIANVSLNDAIGSGQGAIAQEVQLRMQTLLDAYRTGVKIQGVAIKQADPPAAVIDAFKEVSAAEQNRQTSINQARAYAEQIVAKAQGEAAQFERVYTQYKLAPEVTRRRMYYETMEDVLSKVDKTVVEAPGVTPYLPLGGKRVVPPVAQQGEAR